jgi:hypothetical protein
VYGSLSFSGKVSSLSVTTETSISSFPLLGRRSHWHRVSTGLPERGAHCDRM